MRILPSSSARSHKAQLIIAAIVPALIVVLSITGFVWAQKAVTVVVDGEPQTIKTQATTVAELLEETAVKTEGKDVVVPPVEAHLTDGAVVIVRHATPVTVDLGGRSVDVDVVGHTVADALVAAGVDPAAGAAVEPSLTATLEPGMEIDVPDVFVRVRQSETTVAPETKIRKDASLPKGKRRIVTEGQPGVEMRVFRVLVTNGTEGTAALSAVCQVEKAKPRIIAVGTGSKARLAAAKTYRIGKAPKGGREMRVETTGYSPEEPGLDHTTATGARARRGVIAVDPHVIPMGTRVYVPGYGYAVAADTGGAIHGRRIDLCFDTVREAIVWGRRTVTIIILD